jgi:surface protein
MGYRQNVVITKGMFDLAEYFNQPLDSWDVSNVTDMALMFYGAISFNQPLGSWDVSNIANMTSMFSRATRFGQNLCQWFNESYINYPAVKDFFFGKQLS